MQNESRHTSSGKVDRSLSSPLIHQIRARLVHEISSGSLAIGAPLPSVRDLAEAMGVSTMTVSKTYAELKAQGLVATHVGSGTFVADSPLARLSGDHNGRNLLSEMDGLVDSALAAGLDIADLTSLFQARAIHRAGGAARKRVFMVGLFDGATRSYARRLTEQLGPEISVTPLILEQNDPTAEAAAALREADIIVTFASLRDRLVALAPGCPVVAIRFIPAETTRMALAALDPMARMVVVSWLPDFLPVLELGVRRFAPHVQDVTATTMDDPDLPRLVAGADVLVLATGAETVAVHARPGAEQIEYLHMPDPGDVRRLIRPHLDATAPDIIKESKEAS